VAYEKREKRVSVLNKKKERERLIALKVGKNLIIKTRSIVVSHCICFILLLNYYYSTYCFAFISCSLLG
jgi:hypothetical protein